MKIGEASFICDNCNSGFVKGDETVIFHHGNHYHPECYEAMLLKRKAEQVTKESRNKYGFPVDHLPDSNS